MKEYKSVWDVADGILFQFRYQFIPRQNLYQALEAYSKEERDEIHHAIQKLLEDGYMEGYEGNNEIIRATAKGKEFIMDGGYGGHYYEEKRQHEIRTVREQEEAELRRYNLFNAKRIYVMYWISFGMSAIALAISLILLFIKLRE